MTDYVLGQVAAGLTKSKSKVKENKKLAALFTVKAKPPEPQKENVKKPDVNINEKEKKPVKKKRHIEEEKEIKKKKQKIDEEKFKEKVKEKEIEEPESIKTLGTEGEEDSTEKPVHWSKLTGAARRVASKESRKHDTSKDHRTIFIGNLPLSLAHKTKLKKLFGKYGAIESLRFRCPPTKDLTTSKRVAVIKKEFHPERDNMIAYVCYKEEFSAEKALFMNGKEIDGHHLRVDISTANPKANHNKSIFVGNLPFGIGEEDIREIFKVCGEVENVRIIRDNKTGLGKGFCYVAFKKKDQVELALKLDGTGLKKREIRVKRCLREPKKVQQDKDRQIESSRPFRPKKKFNQPSNSVRHSFQGMKAKKSLKDKMKKRKIPRMNSSNSSKQRHPRKDSKEFKNPKPKQFDSGNKAHKRFK